MAWILSDLKKRLRSLLHSGIYMGSGCFPDASIEPLRQRPETGFDLEVSAGPGRPPGRRSLRECVLFEESVERLMQRLEEPGRYSFHTGIALRRSFPWETPSRPANGPTATAELTRVEAALDR